MNSRSLPLLSLLALGLGACELGSKNLGDPHAATDTAGTTGASSSGATEGVSSTDGVGTTSTASGPFTTEPPDTGTSAASSSGGVKLDVDGGTCDDPLNFPGVTKSCQSDADCSLVFHVKDCCGSLEAIGVHGDSVVPFNQAEAACAAKLPPNCGCAPMPTTAEDGDSFENHDVLVVSCVDNMCQSSIPDAGPLQWYTTCGDPVCSGYTKPEGVEPCTPEQLEGAACDTEGVTCDPMSDCNALLVCASEDPKQQEGGCPISRAAFKTDIEYLGLADLERHAADLHSLRLATYRYRQAPADAPARLGIILEDNEQGVWVDAKHDRVDLYGYASLAVAALQVQQRQIAALQTEVERLSAQLDRAPMCGP